MIIIRNGKKITLTPEELEQAYREQKHNYQIADAEERFNDYLRIQFGDVESFEACFGFPADDVCDPDSSFYLLEKFLAAYEKHHDCNTAENDDWHSVIRNTLVENAVNVKVTYDANYVLWDITLPGLARKVTELYPNGYASVDELIAAEPAYLAAAFERHGVCNGNVRFTRQLKKVRNVGNNADFRDWNFLGMGKAFDAVMQGGKLLFDDEA